MGQSRAIHALTELSSACSIELSTSQSITHHEMSAPTSFERTLDVDIAKKSCFADVKERVAEQYVLFHLGFTTSQS
jgi:hypothetical protein